MPELTRLIAQFYIKVDSSDIAENIMDNMVSIEVDDSLNIPDMFTLQVRDPNLELTGADTFEIGKEVEISVRGQNDTSVLMSGEITSIETSFKQGTGAVLVIRGYDQSHRLNRGRQTRSFVQMTDSDIANRIAREMNLRTDVDSTSEVYDYVLQENQTNLEFLQARAARIGFRVMVEGDTLNFKSVPQGGSETPVLEWGDNLIEFNARLTTSRQVSEVEVRAWDPQARREIVGRADRPQGTPEIGENRQGGQIASQAFGQSGREIVVNRPVSTQAEADALAQSLLDEVGDSFIQADGVCGGNPGICAGAMVELQGLSRRFNGRYRISHALQRYDARGYSTRFTISGRNDNTLGGMISRAQSGGSSSGSNGGGSSGGNHSVVVGIVTNNQDPDGLGRVKLRFPWLDENTESNWARLATPMAGGDRGMVFIPEVNDEVIVAFEQGDMNRPYVLGSLWNGEDTPPETNSDGRNNIRKIRSRSGHEIIFDDNDASRQEKLEIHTNAGHTILLNDASGQEKIEIKDKTGNNSIKFDSVQNSIDIESSVKLKIKSRMIEIESEGTMSLKANATLTIQGALVQIN